MIYNIALTPEGVQKIGQVLDKEPYGEVAALVVNIQAQIVAQEKAERARIEAEMKTHDEAVRAEERAKVSAEFAIAHHGWGPPKPPRPPRKRKKTKKGD